MKRFLFVVHAAVLVVWIWSGSSLEGAERAAREDSPNILFLLTDDQRWDALGCMGNSIIRTPHIDRMAARGTIFQNAFVTTSICAVSRASILSGQYERRHQIGDFATPFSEEAFKQTYPALLRKQGYRTGFIGKYGVGNVMPKEEFDFWAGFPGQGRFFEGENSKHLTARMGDDALEFLAGSKGKEPFCLSISFKAPHAQDGAPREFPPDPQDETLYSGIVMPMARTATEERFGLEPEFVRESEGRRRWARRFADAEMHQNTVRDYYRLITGVDREVGRILEALEQMGTASNTIVIFSSDNGFFLGERGLAGKWLMHEESIRVPLIIYDPRLGNGTRAGSVDATALNIDLAPTMLDYAAVEIPQGMQGRSLRPWVEGREVADWREDWFYEHHFGPHIIPRSEGVRTDRWKYIRYIDADPMVEELYDLKSDPMEENNLAGISEHEEKMERMRRRWAELREELR
jgi:arylsulfatase A-like enzyme